MDGLDDDGSGSHCRGHPLYRPVPDVADGKDTGHARFHWQGKVSEWPAPRGLGVLHEEVLAGEDIASLVALYLLGQPPGVRLGTDEDEQGRGGNGFSDPGGKILKYEPLEPALPAATDDPGVEAYLDVLRRLDFFDQVVGH